MKTSSFLMAAVLFAVVQSGMKCASTGMCLPARTLDVTVQSMGGIPETCRSGLMKHRSSVPHDESDGFCGAIHTDYGPFRVKNSGWSLWSSDREEIVRSLAPGCRYRVAFYGGRYRFEDMVKYSPRLRNRGVPVIHEVIEPLGCASGK